MNHFLPGNWHVDNVKTQPELLQTSFYLLQDSQSYVNVCFSLLAGHTLLRKLTVKLYVRFGLQAIVHFIWKAYY